LKTIRANILETEYYFCAGDLEGAWKAMFNTVACALSLGLHSEARFRSSVENEERFGLWLKVDRLSVLLSSISGRPNPISKSFFPTTLSLNSEDQRTIRVSDVLRNINLELSYNVQIDYAEAAGYDKILQRELKELCNKRNLIAGTILTASDLIDSELIILLASQIKIHALFYETQQYSRSKLFEALSRVLKIVCEFLNRREGFVGSSSPWLEAYIFQSISALHVFLNGNKNKPSYSAMIEFLGTEAGSNVMLAIMHLNREQYVWKDNLKAILKKLDTMLRTLV
jgi:hypothetical protein